VINLTHIERFLKWKLCDVKVARREYVCRICGETLFYRGTKENDIKMHFYNKHREIYLIARKCDLGDKEYCDMLDAILKKYGKKEVKKE
jgi:hypothetical protein